MARKKGRGREESIQEKKDEGGKWKRKKWTVGRRVLKGRRKEIEEEEEEEGNEGRE